MLRRYVLVVPILLFSACAATSPVKPDAAPVALSSSIASVPRKDGCYPGTCGIPPMTDAEVKVVVSAEAHAILREGGTERPFTSPLLEEHRKGTYVAADSGEPLFRSETKFDSGTGWPSFYEPISPDAVVEHADRTLGMTRTEVLTHNGSHLGHVFTDGPEPTGLRYCMNGLALRFVPDAQQ